jgi:hypothetical protein
MVLLTYPKVIEVSSGSKNKEDQWPPMTGSIDEIGSDIRRIKAMGVEHIIFGFSFLPIDNGSGVDYTPLTESECI